MLVDKMKEVQLVAESKLLKINPETRTFSRYDKTVFIIEPVPSNIQLTGSKIAYVEAARFFALFSEVKSIDIQEDCCLLTLNNEGEYKLPYIIAEWDDQSVNLPDKPAAKIKLVSGRLSSATLKNLANPMLQCIYIDGATAVSCNSMVACIDGTVTSKTALLLPPDIISIIEGNETEIYIVEGNYVLQVEKGKIFVPVPDLDYKESADVLRGALPEQIDRYPTSHLLDSLKRLSAAHEYVVFKKDKLQADEDYEPFNFPKANEKFMYNIQSLLSVVGQTNSIAQSDYALLFYGDQYLFMVSPEPTEDEEEDQYIESRGDIDEEEESEAVPF